MKKSIDKGISERIKSRRKELGLTLKQVAKVLNVTEATVSRYESQEIQNMGIDKLEPLSKILKCSPVFLLTGYSNFKDIDDTTKEIKNYKLSKEEEEEIKKIFDMNLLMLNDKNILDEDKNELEKVIKNIFIKNKLYKKNKGK